MSHFTILVLTKHGKESEVKRLLEPFDENIKMDEYDTDCHCMGEVAEREAEKEADKKFGTYDEMRKAFATRYGEGNKENWDDEIRRKKWQEEFTNPRQKYVHELVAKHPMKDKQNPICLWLVSDLRMKVGVVGLAGSRVPTIQNLSGIGTLLVVDGPVSQMITTQLLILITLKCAGSVKDLV